MEPVQETRERQRLFIPTRSAVRQAGQRSAGGPGGDGPWAADSPWRPAGQDPDYEPDTGHPFRARLGLLGLIALANLGLLASSVLLENVIVLLDVLGIVIVIDLLLKLWQASRRIRPRMRWTTFPAFLGGRLEGVLVTRGALEPIGAARAILRCVRDERVPAEDGSGAAVEPAAIYRQITEFPITADRLKVLPVAFDLPADLPGTDLKNDEPVYWQVALQIPTIGPDFETVFLAPVYARLDSSMK